MDISKEIAKHVKAVHFGGNWTDVNLKDTLENITWEKAITKVHDFNTIAELTFHMNYFISGVIEVLKGNSLTIKDKYSYDLLPISSEDDWKLLLDKTFADAIEFGNLIEQIPESKLLDVFVNNKYGNYYGNLTGIIEHTHYHLGQIVLIKKLIINQNNNL